ncbi:hypothetical protein ACMHYB_58730 [Sorangium sp. So ce1128]
MIEDARRVRRLHLRGPDRAALGRAQPAIVDALRTASVPGAGDRRLIFIRRLDLGAVRDGAAPASIALRIERLLAAASAGAVAWDAPDAPRRPAVFFPDAVEPLVALAAVVAAGRPADAWFWPAAVAGFSPRALPVDTLRRLLRAALATPAGVAAAARVLAACVASPAGEALLAGLSAEEGTALAGAAGLGEPRAAASPPPAIPRRFAAALARWVPRWGRADGRSRWLAAAALVAERPDRTGPALPALVEAVLGAAHALAAPALVAPPPARRASRRRARPAAAARGALPVVESAGPAPGPASGEPPPAAAPTVPPADRRAGSGARAPAGEARPSGEARDATPGDARDDEGAEPLLTPAARPLEEAAGTEHGGLFFLLTVLRHLGIEGFLDEHPALADAGLAARLLSAAADRLGVPAHDPVRAALTIPDAPLLPGAFVAPARWFAGLLDEPRSLLIRRGRLEDAAGWVLASWTGRRPPQLRERLAGVRLARTRAALAGSDRGRGVNAGGAGRDASDRDGARDDGARHARHLAAPPDPVTAWLIAAERWLARFTELDLPTLVRRRGAVRLTRTHLDVDFALGGADIRVRRPGLDLDPGWVPFFGRVVAYHYGRGHV